MIGPSSLLAWVMLVGFAITAPVAAVEGVPSGLDARAIGWLTVSGLGNVTGLLFAYGALRIGKVAVVAPIVSTEGAIAAVISVMAGETIAPSAGATLGIIALGICVAAIASDEDAETAERGVARAALYAIAAAFSFGASLFATARASVDLPVVWAVLPARLAGVVFVALPLVATSRLRLTRRALPLVVAGGVCEVVGFASFALVSRHGIAVSAVLASQFGAIAAVAGFLLFRERLAPVQLAGVVTIIVGVSVLSVLQAS
jgi:drug/metabolite transporter (DMT)-like permease